MHISVRELRAILVSLVWRFRPPPLRISIPAFFIFLIPRSLLPLWPTAVLLAGPFPVFRCGPTHIFLLLPLCPLGRSSFPLEYRRPSLQVTSSFLTLPCSRSARPLDCRGLARARATCRALRSPLGSVFRRRVPPVSFASLRGCFRHIPSAPFGSPCILRHIRYRSVFLRFTSWLFSLVPSWLLSLVSCGRRASLAATPQPLCPQLHLSPGGAFFISLSHFLLRAWQTHELVHRAIPLSSTPLFSMCGASVCGAALA